MNNFYLYVKRKKQTMELTHCEKVEVKNVIKMDKIFSFNVFFHLTQKEDLKYYLCTEVLTGINFCKSDSLEDCVAQFDEMKTTAKLKDVALAMGKAKSLVHEFQNKI